jgi:hypothetical protein
MARPPVAICCARPAAELAITWVEFMVTRCARPAAELAITMGR